MKAEDGLAAARKLAHQLGEALAAIRATAPQLGFGIRVDSQGERLWLNFRVWDPPDTMRQALTALSDTDFGGCQTWGWATEQRAWIPI